MPALFPADPPSPYSPQHRWGGGDGARKRRLVALALTIALHVLVVILIIYIRAPLPPRKEERGLTGFSLPAPATSQKEKGDAAERESKEKERTPDSAPPPPAAVPPPIPSAIPVPQTQSAFIEIDSAQFAASDISKLKKSGGTPGSGDSKAAYGPGEGPGGATLYNADWYREPTNAELSGYIPARAPQRGWGRVACRTVPDNRVENCQSIGEFPQGSGFARAVREAAWQFRVLPPRINGKPQIGEWVNICISYGMDKDSPKC